MTHNLDSFLSRLADSIEKIDGERRSGLKYKSYERLILDLGEPFKPAKRPKGVRKMQSRRCFQNAFSLSFFREDLRYVEGYALSDAGLIPVLHAWCAFEDGTVLDPTWAEPEKAEYRGIAFDKDLVAKVLVAQGVYGIIAEDYMNRATLLRTGELRVPERRGKRGD